ncbi:MAG: hypothetical protein GY747_00930 [Planctomycetes bacterium]|nr:hypothetical protein [Planctomycetota bacterium]MCP4769791.1 hypothetical protein [Planctomycetota bacterium]MCP4859631.1 hypothetical protein [Planctomycetota bacterium]
MTTHSPLDGLLEVCDQLRALHDNAARGAIPSEDTLRRTRERVAELGPQAFELLPGIQNQPLAESLNSHELLVLALLFHRRVSGTSDALPGTTLIGLLLRAGVPRSEALRLLGPNASLRKESWMMAEITRNGLDPLDGFFLPTTASLALFWPQQDKAEKGESQPSAEAGNDTPVENTAPIVDPKLTPYSSEQEYLWDLYAWRQACLKRAATLFDVDPDQPQHPQAMELREQARRCWVGIRQRLSLTPESRDFGLEKLAADFRLGPNHVLVVTHMLFAEILDAELYLSPMECLRLVADRREAAFTMRSLLAPKSRLRREGIVLSEGEDSAKILAVPLSLADWVVERVLAGLGRSPKWSQQDLEDFLAGESGR